jgi:tetratricopeptide (TPR) repeat protein
MSPTRLTLAATVGILLCTGNEVLASRPSAPLFDDAGEHHHAVTTSSPMAQRFFNQGMVLLYGFNHAEAIRSFTAVTEADPQCAMAYWGIAYAHGPNINRPMDPSAVPLAWTALQKAQSLEANASPRERGYIEALAKRYKAEPVEDRSAMDLAYAEAMREVMRQNPDDLDAAALFAEAVMDTMPWDYWQSDRRPKPAMIEVMGVLRDVLRRDPDHPGANHFFIHAVEAGPTPEDALPAADRLRALELSAAPHLIHMPSHIYLRTGLYEDAIEANRIAARKDEQYIDSCKAQGFYPATYYPHNVHFLWYANLMLGRAEDAIKTARRIEELEMDTRCGPSSLSEAPRFRHLTLLTLARFGRWNELARVKEPGPEYPLDLAFWHFARGLAAIARNDATLASRHLAEMHRLGQTPDLKNVESPIFPATKVFAVAEMVLAGRTALARGGTARGLDDLRKAVALEDDLPYMEPPFWHAPTRQTLGAALLAIDQPADAESIFRADLERNPRNGWSLRGLEESLRRQHKTDAADSVARELAQAWKRVDAPPQLEWY